MALNWDVTKVVDCAAIGVGEDADPNEWVVTDTVLWATMLVALGEITEKNWTEFYARIALWERLNGSYLRASENDGGGPRPLTPEDIRKRIGLRCNVSDETRLQWMKRIIGNAMQSLERQALEDAAKVLAAV